MTSLKTILGRPLPRILPHRAAPSESQRRPAPAGTLSRQDGGTVDAAGSGPVFGEDARWNPGASPGPDTLAYRAPLHLAAGTSETGDEHECECDYGCFCCDTTREWRRV